MDYDFVFSSNPINAEAAKALQKGEHYESKRKIVEVTSDVPLKTCRFTGPKEDDLTGRRFGRLLVIGHYGSSRKSTKRSGSLWVCRCACGRYVTLRNRAIKNENNAADCCQYCREIQFFKKRQYWKETGHNKDVR